MTVTVKGKTIPIRWMWLVEQTGELMIEYADSRPMSQIAADWEGLERLKRESDTEGDAVYEGFTLIRRMVKDPIRPEMVQLVLVQP